MTAINHAAGGYVVSGVLCSFVNINIFSRLEYLIVIFFASVFADVDLRNSFSGVVFRPISNFVCRRWAHRTLTHSFIFNFLIVTLLYVIQRFIHFNTAFIYITAFALFSHLLLDMMTLQGISLFYPFKANKAVLPGNKKFRIATGDLRSESIFFFILFLVNFSLTDLYANGFWLSYNQKFSTIKHVHAQNINSSNFVKCAYDFDRNTIKYIDTAIVLYSSESELVMFKNNKFIKLNKSDVYTKIKNTTPINTAIPKKTDKIYFSNISTDSINRLIADKIILEYEYISNSKFIYLSEEKTKVSGHDTYNEFIISVTEETEQEPDLQAEKEQIKYKRKLQEFKEAQTEIADLKRNYDNKTTYEKTKIFERIKELERINEPDKPIIIKKPEKQKKQGLFSGFIEFAEIN